MTNKEQILKDFEDRFSYLTDSPGDRMNENILDTMVENLGQALDSHLSQYKEELEKKIKEMIKRKEERLRDSSTPPVIRAMVSSDIILLKHVLPLLK